MTNSTEQTSAVGTDGTKVVKEIKEIPIHWIKTKGTQTRALGLNQETVNDYAAAMSDSATFPPVVVYSDGTTNTDGTKNFWIADGAHRAAAAKKAGFNHLRCEVRPGNEREALRHGLSANAKHGLARSNADKRHCISLALADREWGQLSHNAIAELCGVSAPTVARVADELSASGGESDSTVKNLQLNPEDGPNKLTTEESQPGSPVLQLPDTKRLGKDGKWRSTPQPKPAPDSGPQTDVQEPAAKGPDQTPNGKVKYKNGMPYKNEKPVLNGSSVISGLLINRLQDDLNQLGRQLQAAGKFKQYNSRLSDAIEFVREAGGLKPLPVKDSGFQNPAPANRPQPKPPQPQPKPQPANQIDEKAPF